ncbi:MAG: PKD domain-containing protein [Bacteroidia bacterium]|nr:PKD domain-containing protein [Bacteroidia bacterium]MBP7260307.1 PKD domain-containing protein [Bacteroidia bacterium]MBP9723939.1 PKD domain-containing protein [Bacteroidia bacterium]
MKISVYTVKGILLLLSFIIHTRVDAQVSYNYMPQTDGTVRALAHKGDTVFVGGSFNCIYSKDSSITNYAARFGFNNNNIVLGKPNPDNAVLSSISYGQNGFIAGGNFTTYGDSVRYGIAHLDSSGKVSGLLSQAGVNGPIHSMALQGDTLFVGGSFSRAAVPIASGGAEISTNGLVKNFPYINGDVYSVASDGNGGWYIGGEFSQIGSVQRYCLAHVDSNRNVTSWNPNVNSIVKQIIVTSNSVYIGGGFTRVGTQTRIALACVSRQTGQANSWQPSVVDTTFSVVDVRSMVLHNGILYIAGGFNKINGVPRRCIAAISPVSSTGVFPFNPSPNQVVYAICIDNGTLYMGGAFTSIGAVTRNRLASIDLSNNSLTSWNPNMSGNVHAIYAFNNRIYAGGLFTSPRIRLAEFLATGSMTPWNPAPNADVTSLFVNANGVHAGGKFNYIGGSKRNKLALLDFTTGSAVSSWDPEPNGDIYVVNGDSNKIFVGGNFNTIGGTKRKNLCAFSLTNGLLPIISTGVDSTVYALTLSGGVLYAGGFFSNAEGQVRNRLAAFNTTSGALTSFSPVVTGTAYIYALASQNNILYVGGYFTLIGGQSRSNLASINLSTGTVMPLNINFNNIIVSLSVYGNTLYAGGNFTIVGAQSRNYAAAINLSTSTVKSWNPLLNGMVKTLACREGVVYLGGHFTKAGTLKRDYIASVDTGTAVCTPWTPDFSAVVNTITPSQDYLYVGSYSLVINGIKRSRLAAFLASTGEILPWNPGANNTVNVLKVDNNIVYAGGKFDTVSTFPRQRIVAIDYLSGVPTAWVPQGYSVETAAVATKDSLVYLGGSFTLAAYHKTTGTQLWAVSGNGAKTIEVSNNTAFVGGGFNSLNGISRSHIGAVNATTGAVTGWNPGGGNTDAVSMKVWENKVYVGGFSNYMGGQARSRLASLDTSTGLATSWDPNSNGSVYQIFIDTGVCYALGKFEKVGNKGRMNVAAIDLNTGEATPWMADVYSFAFAIDIVGDKVFIGGVFDKSMGFGSPNYLTCFSKYFLATDLGGQSSFCQGAQYRLPVLMGDSAKAGNIISVQLSRKEDNFSNPIIIGSLNARKTDTIAITIPDTLNTQHNYRLRVVCSNPNIASKDNGEDISIFASPKAAFSVNQYQQCLAGNIFVFNDTSATVSGSLTSEWSFGDNTSSSNVQVQKTYAVADSFWVKLVSRGNGGCSDSISKKVTVFPDASILSISVNDSEQCRGGNIFTFNDSCFVQSGTFSRMWLFSDNTSTLLPDPQKSFTSSGTFDVQLVATTDKGCKDSAVMSVVVYPQANIQFTVNDSQQCLKGNKFVFSNQSSVASGTFSSYWTFGDSAASSSPNVQHSYNNTGSYNVWLRTITNNGCVDSLYRQVSLFGHPAASFTCADTQQCLNGNVFAFTNTSVSSVSYLWNFGNSATTVQMSPQYTYANSGVFDVRLISYDSNGCTDTTGRKIYVEAPPAPPQLTVTPDSVVCAGTVVTLRCASTFNKEWFKDSTPLSIFTDSLVLQSSTGYYHVEVRNAANCASGSVPIYILFKSVPVKPNVTASGSLFTSNAPYGNQWYNTAGILSGDTGVTYTASAANVYYSIVTVNGCSSDSSNNITYPATGVVRPEQSMQVLVYPNPNNGDFTLACNSCPSSGSYNILLTDYCGKQLLKESVADLSSVRIRTNGLAAGLYLLSVTSAEGTARIPVFIR